MNIPITPRVSPRATMRVRFFRERDLRTIERSINEWLAERADREIAEIRQSVVADTSGVGQVGEVLVSIWYIEG
ncbi:MAG TPA: hypothetical protein VF188_03225 [Longimicrobiales bacterium]